MTTAIPKNPIILPRDYDYVACYMVDYCFLKCSYCITDHNATEFTSGKNQKHDLMSEDQWIETFERIQFPEGVVPSLQGGEPFLYRKIWDIIERSPVQLDILTALPPVVKREKFKKLSNLSKLNRGAAYPNIRVSYHVGQNDIENLAPRVAELQDLVSIGIYIVDHPDVAEERERAREICERYGVLFKTKEYLGYHNGVLHGTYRYDDACVGEVTKPLVYCKNSVLIIAPNGDVYRCHSDLYHKRHNLRVGNVTDPTFSIPQEHQACYSYGLCSECDVKVKTNHFQVFGYTSADIIFPETTPELEIPSLTGRESLRVL